MWAGVRLEAFFLAYIRLVSELGMLAEKWSLQVSEHVS